MSRLATTMIDVLVGTIVARQWSAQGHTLQITANLQVVRRQKTVHSLLVKFGRALVNCLEIIAEERGSADSIRLVPATVSGCCCCRCFCVLFTLMPVTAANSRVAKCFSLHSLLLSLTWICNSTAGRKLCHQAKVSVKGVHQTRQRPVAVCSEFDCCCSTLSHHTKLN